MRAALARLLVWAALAAPIVGALELAYRATPPGAVEWRFRRVAAQADELEVLVLGSSHMWSGVDPAALGPRAANLASRSQDLYYDGRILAALLPRAPRLRVVVAELSPLLLGHDVEAEGQEGVLRTSYDPLFPRRSGRRRSILRHVALLTRRGHDPVRFALRALRGGRPAGEARADGWAPPGEYPERADDGGARWREHTRLFRPELVAGNAELLVEMARAARARGVRVVLVNPPHAPAYSGGGPMAEAWARERDRIVRATGAEFHDLGDALPVGEGLFLDADHLQSAGAARFSRVLADILARDPR